MSDTAVLNCEGFADKNTAISRLQSNADDGGLASNKYKYL
ncbi:hypothetical protein AAKU52_000821 [Pedobacter sp. CG_S7]